MEYASKGIANAGLATGIIGTTLGVINGGLGMLGNVGGLQCHQQCSENNPINRYEATLMQELSVKESENALLRADKYTDQKIVEAYKDLQGQIKDLSAEVRANKEEQSAINMQQAVYNGTNTTAISCIQQSIAALQNCCNAITKVVVPNSAICPGWGNVNVTPATTTTPAA